MTVDSPENKVYVSVTNSEELKTLCTKAEEAVKTLRELIQQIDKFELTIKIE